MISRKNHYTAAAVFVISFLICISFIKTRGTVRQSPKTSGAMAALNFWTDLRAYPGADIPSDKYFRAYRYAKQQFKETAAKTTSRWEPFGPLNVPGRMLSIAINPKNPKTIYAGSASGGLWRSYSGGTGGAWKQVTTGYPVLGVMAIAIDPTDTNIIYIGTGEVYRYQGSMGGFNLRTTRGSYGLGILKTTDGGNSWLKSLDWSYNQERGVEALRINPKNHHTIFAATSEGIYKSVNSGQNWNLILPILMGEDIAINPKDTSLIMASCGNLGSAGSGVYRTTTGGDSWSQLPGLPNFSGKTLLEMYGANPNMVFASVADSTNDNYTGLGIWKTTNFGTSWSLINNLNIPQVQGWYSHYVTVHPTDSSQIIYAGVPIVKSADGGNNFYGLPYIHSDHHNYAHHPTNPNCLYVVTDGGVYRSTNFGDNFEDLGYGLQTAQFYNGFSSSAQDSLLAMGGLQDNNTVIYRGNPSQWDQVIGGDGCWTGINPSNDTVMYGEYQYNALFKSVNQGYSFFTVSSSLYGYAAFVSPFIISPSNPSVVYSGRIYMFKSTDEAGTWAETNDLDFNPILSLGISRTNSDSVYAGTAPFYFRPQIFFTSDGGNLWSNITQTLPDRYPMDLAVDPVSSNVVYVVLGGFGSGHVFKSTNSGASWADITGVLPDAPTLAIAIDPFNNNHIYVGNDVGVYLSTDGGGNWTGYSEGLPEAVTAMDLNISTSNKMLRVATHGNGAYQRKLFSASQTTSVSAEPILPKAYLLHQNHPNPFNPVTNIEVELPEKTFASLRIFDAAGREVAVLAEGQYTAGTHRFTVNLGDMPSGIYFYCLSAGNFREAKKMVLLK